MVRYVCLVIICTTLCLPAAAVTWMRDAVVSEFSDSDWEILRGEVNRVLDTVADDEQVDWKNAETGSHGSLKVLKSFELDGQRCRRLAAKNVNAKGREGAMAHNLCRQADGAWKFVSDSAVK